MHSQKLDHELNNLIQEVRVAMPGVQILFAFLLVVPFNQRFREVSTAGLALFGIALASVTISSFLFITPTVYHRVHHRRDVENFESMLRLFGRIAIAGSAFLALAIVMGLTFLADFLFGDAAAAGTAVIAGLLVVSLWYGLPWVRFRREKRFHLPVPPRGRRTHEHLSEAYAHR